MHILARFREFLPISFETSDRLLAFRIFPQAETPLSARNVLPLTFHEFFWIAYPPHRVDEENEKDEIDVDVAVAHHEPKTVPYLREIVEISGYVFLRFSSFQCSS